MSDAGRTFRYPRHATLADLLRAAAGLALCAGLLLFVHPAPFVAWALAAASALFLIYFVRTVVRHLTRITLDETGISARGPRGVSIRWEDLRAVRLNYYSTRSDRSGGWMQLDLRGAGRSRRAKLGIESTLDGFPAVVAAVVAEATRRGCALDADSLANLRALGLAPPAESGGR